MSVTSVTGTSRAADASTTSSVDTSGATTTTASAANADYDTFLKLMVAQMQNQDPTEPMDATQFVSQLASFSSVEQAIQTNTKLDSMLIESRITQAQDYVGKYIEFDDGAGNTTAGSVVSVSIYSNILTAKLDNGEEVVLGPGVTIRDKAPTAETPVTETPATETPESETTA